MVSISLLVTLDLTPAALPLSAPHIKPVTMTAHTRKAKEPLLDSRIDILNRNAVEVPPANQVFGTVSAILALVRVSSLVLCPSVNCS